MMATPATANATLSCPIALDFETDAHGAPILAGQDLSEVYADYGVHISVMKSMTPGDTGTPIAFDSANPTGGDPDLGTPNEAFGGPGVGAGGNPSNDTARGMVLVSADNTTDANGDGYVDVPNDDAAGGWIIFKFDRPMCVKTVDVLDIDDNEGPPVINAYDDEGTSIAEVTGATLGDNSFQRLTLDVCGAAELVVDLDSSGAVPGIEVCPDGECGDGITQPALGEQCDGEPNCTEGCTLTDDETFGTEKALTQVLWIPHLATDLDWVEGGLWVENGDGTATLQGTLARRSDPDKRLVVDWLFSNRVEPGDADYPPFNSPLKELPSTDYVPDGPIDPASWYFYTDLAGTLTGESDWAGAAIDMGVHLGVSAPQVGLGANGRTHDFGMSAWLAGTVTSRPTAGDPFPEDLGGIDINVDLIADCSFCGDGTQDDGEECDDGNNTGGDGCAADCTVEPFCGDGTHDDGEECSPERPSNGRGES